MEASQALLAPAVSETAERLFREHSGWIYGYCLRLLRSPEDAEDAVQATYLNACRGLSQGVRPQVDSAWLLRITQNACLTRLRSSSRRARFEHAGDFALLEETVPAPDRPVDDLIGLADALAQLPEQQRRAILLREWQGLSHSEVAQQLGLTRAAAETLIFRARRSLAAALENPARRARLRSLHALDLGGLLAAIKGFFTGAAGVKAVAAVVVVATTATAVATDPAGVWRDRHEHAQSPAAERASRPAPASRTVWSAPAWAPADAGERVAPRPHEPTIQVVEQAPAKATVTPATARTPTGSGKTFGQSTAAAARAQPKAHVPPKAAAPPRSLSGRGRRAGGGRLHPAGKAGPPPHAPADGHAKGKGTKPSGSD